MNMRKIIAVLSAALLLCAAIPMGALTVVAAPGDVILDINFDDGSNGGFERSYNENGYIVFDATTADWQNTYAYKNGFQTNVDYVVTFKAKASKDTTMNFKINDNWGPDAAAFTVNVTTEWQEFEGIINMASLSSAIVMFSSNATAADAATYYIDDLKIVEYVEPVEPGTVANGDFETGDLSGWAVHQSTAISTDAHSGSYAANIKGNGGWGGMLNQDIPVNAGKTYKVSVWAKANANGANVQIKDGGTSGANLANQWFTATEWTELVWEVIPTTDVICFNFCGGGNGVAEDVLVDDITVTELKQPSDDGFIKNGDFEIGEATPWTVYSGTAVDAVAAKDGDYGLYVKNPTGGWGGTAYQDFTVEVGKTYVVMMDAKAIANGQNIQIQNPIGTKVDSKWFTATDWTTLTFEFTATATDVRINICGGGTGANEEIYVDNVFVFEKKDAANDGYIVNGDFETGVASPWNTYQSTAISTDAAHTGNFGMHIVGVGNWGGLLEQNVSNLIVGKNYAFSFWMKVNHKGVNVKIGDTYLGWYDTVSDWTLVTKEFTATATTAKILINGGGDGTANPDLAADIYVDDFSIVELIDPSFDGYIYNGDFETGKLSPWINLYNSNEVTFVEGYESNYAMQMVVPADKVWSQVRQNEISVEANSTYRLTAYVKNAENMAFVIKTGDDQHDLTAHSQCIFPAGEDWQLVTLDIDTGITVDAKGNDIEYAIDSICVLIINYEAGASVIIDNIVLEEVVPCEHEYDDCMDADCNLCGETREPGHVLTYFEAVVATNCQETGHAEYWHCENCDCYFGDAEATWQHNPGWLFTTGDCVRPEGAADCATVPCELCGNDIYGYGEHDTGVPACQDGTCSKCNQAVTGYGHQNYDGPACLPGNCYYCGEAMEPVAHENGAWAPCLEGECSYGCGLTYPATAEHVDEDGDDYCDTCWNHLAHVDEDGNGECDICWEMMPEEPEVVYGDANGDGIVDLKDVALLQQYTAGWEVTLDDAAADANGDGIVDLKDVALLQQYTAGWDVDLGPQG